MKRFEQICCSISNNNNNIKTHTNPKESSTDRLASRRCISHASYHLKISFERTKLSYLSIASFFSLVFFFLFFCLCITYIFLYRQFDAELYRTRSYRLTTIKTDKTSSKRFRLLLAILKLQMHTSYSTDLKMCVCLF